MFQTQYSLNIKTSKLRIWEIWSDVNNWNKYDHEIEWSKLKGPFEKGTTGILKPKGGPEAKFIITYCEKNKGFCDVTNLPLTQLYFIHEMKESTDGVVVTHTIKMIGILSFLFAKIMGKKFEEGLPKAMNKLAQLATS